MFNQALKEHMSGNHKNAIDLYKKCIKNNLNLVQSYNNLGLIYYAKKKFEESEIYLLKAIKHDDFFIDAHNNISVLYSKIQKFDLAILHAKICLKHNPKNPNILINLGNFLSSINDFDEARKSYLRSIALDTKNKLALNNLASLEYDLGYCKKSIELYKAAIEIDNSWFLVKKNIGISYLKLKIFKEGFINFELRKKEVAKEEYKYQPINLKLWEGEDLNKKILIVYSEGGIGDTIHFARYIKNLKERYSVKIYLKIDKRIKHLFKSLGISFIDEESEIPKSDYYCLIMYLAKIHFDKFFKVLEQNYKIANDVNISLAWGKKLEKIKNPRIGVCWKGNKNNKNDFFRSIKYITLSKLFKLEEINFISLQQYIELDELEKINKVKNFTHFNSTMDKNNKAFEDTIGIIRNVDLVITCDTSIAHLSATLNKETWILLSTGSDWRWFTKDVKTPWYQNVKLFRQLKINKWESVIKKIKNELINKFELNL